MIRPQLLCTFSNFEDYESDIEKIREFYTIVFNKIFILQNMSGFLPRTISVHRKKESNTIYTINALNEVIKSLNDGQENPNYRIKWDDFRNCIILTDEEDGYKKIPTKLFDIFDL